MSTKTPEQRAEERIPWDQATIDAVGLPYDGVHNTRDIARAAYAAAIREEVEPRDRLLQELVNALAYATESMNCDDWGEVDLNGEGAMAPYAHDIVSMPGGCPLCNATAALAKANEQFGITPNT